MFAFKSNLSLQTGIFLHFYIHIFLFSFLISETPRVAFRAGVPFFIPQGPGVFQAALFSVHCPLSFLLGRHVG